MADITDAYMLLDPLLGVKLAGLFFAVALLAAGQNSTLTGTLAGQIIMEGFLNIKLKPWLRRLITRLLAIVPALIVAIIYGEKGKAVIYFTLTPENQGLIQENRIKLLISN